jgi:hypothetical protein
MYVGFRMRMSAGYELFSDEHEREPDKERNRDCHRREIVTPRGNS